MLRKLPLSLLVFLLFQSALAQYKPALSETDRIRLTEAFRLGDALGDRIWKDWSLAPFAVLLITPDQEFLVRHPKPSEDFTLIGYDYGKKESRVIPSTMLLNSRRRATSRAKSLRV